MGEPARRQFWPHPLDDNRARDPDGRSDGRTERQTPVSPSFRPSSPVRPSPARAARRALTALESGTARWLETYCCTDIPKHFRPLLVAHHAWFTKTFIGGRAFVLKYGAANIINTILHDLTIVYDPRGDEAYAERYWRPEIVSPAHFLHHIVKEMHDHWPHQEGP